MMAVSREYEGRRLRTGRRVHRNVYLVKKGAVEPSDEDTMVFMCMTDTLAVEIVRRWNALGALMEDIDGSPLAAEPGDGVS